MTRIIPLPILVIFLSGCQTEHASPTSDGRPVNEAEQEIVTTDSILTADSTIAAGHAADIVRLVFQGDQPDSLVGEAYLGIGTLVAEGQLKVHHEAHRGFVDPEFWELLKTE